MEDAKITETQRMLMQLIKWYKNQYGLNFQEAVTFIKADLKEIAQAESKT